MFNLAISNNKYIFHFQYVFSVIPPLNAIYALHSITLFLILYNVHSRCFLRQYRLKSLPRSFLISNHNSATISGYVLNAEMKCLLCVPSQRCVLYVISLLYDLKYSRYSSYIIFYYIILRTKNNFVWQKAIVYTYKKLYSKKYD